MNIHEYAKQYAVSQAGEFNINSGVINYISQHDTQAGLCLPPAHPHYYFPEIKSPRRKSHMSAYDMNNGCPHFYNESDDPNCYYPRNSKGKELWKVVQKKMKEKEIEFLLKDLQSEYPGYTN